MPTGPAHSRKCFPERHWQNQDVYKRQLWHFIPGLALSAVITGVALWGGSIPAVAGAGFSALTLAILLGMVLGNTIYPHIWKSCDGGVPVSYTHLDVYKRQRFCPV